MDPRHLSTSVLVRLHLPAVLDAGPVALRLLRAGLRDGAAMVVAG